MKQPVTKIAAWVLSLAPLLSACESEPIGTIRGAEFDEIVIDGIVYCRDHADEYQSFTSADKGGCLGTVSNGDETFWIYAVKGDSDQRFLYARWDLEGDFYVQKDLTQTD